MTHRNIRSTLATACLAAAGFCFLPGQVQAQSMSAGELLQQAREALGNTGARGIAYTASGWDACLGQAWLVTEGWARWELTDYSRVVDLQNNATRHTAQRRAGLDPDKIGGCGAQPNASPGNQQSFANTDSAWLDQFILWASPQGFLDLMDANDASVNSSATGWQLSANVENQGITYPFTANFNEEFELLGINTQADDSVYGNMDVEASFGAYQDFSGVTFPQSITISQGGLAVLHLEIDSAAPSDEVVEASAGDGRGMPPSSGPAWSEVSDGLFVVNGNYQAPVMEFETFVVVLDGLQSDAKAQEIISLIKENIPGKPIRYVLSTHSHFDHASGLRQFAAEGSIILTHEDNVAFFEEALSAPRTLRTTATEPDTVTPHVQGVSDRFVISDHSGKSVEIIALGPNSHAADFLIAWLPEEKLIVEADILQPWINPIFGGDNGPHPFLVYFGEELDALGLDYEGFIPVHVPPEPPLMTRGDLDEVLGR